MKVIDYKMIKPVWGKTSMDVLNATLNEVSCLNTPAPFESVPDVPDMNGLAARMKAACDKATETRRKGMMISSQFRVEVSKSEVLVFHVKNEKPEQLFIIFFLI